MAKESRLGNEPNPEFAESSVPAKHDARPMEDQKTIKPKRRPRHSYLDDEDAEDLARDDFTHLF